ncbi:MAG: hypothetical protein IKG88_08200 [Bacteroidales bacterium]|nr:hypothetical protein [Bacteroidales bacterium]
MKNKSTLLPAILMVALFITPCMHNGLRAQNGFNIPFSQFGIGQNDMPFNMPAFMGMGGITYTRSAYNSINPFNPASYAAVQPESFVFDLGLNIQTCVLRQDANKLSDADGNLAYIMVAFPITKWWKTSAGLLPYSTVNYESIHTADNPELQSSAKTNYAGHGGVSQFYWGNAFNITNRLSVGFNLNYLYGTITRAISYSFPGNDTTYFINSRSQKNTYVNNLLIDLGLQYRQPLGEQYSLLVGVTCSVPRNMKLKDQSLVYTYHNNGTEEHLLDTIFPLPNVPSTYHSNLTQPFAIGGGLALERNERWQVAVDGYYAPYSGLRYEENPDYNLFGSSILCYAPNYRVALGFEWKGIADATNYLQRIGISVGCFHNHGRLSIQGDNGIRSLNETGAGMGFRLPVRKGRSILSLSLGYSSYGNASILRRDVFTFGLSVSSCESWFVKRRYN